jgi:pimeloyl-ACP methyl ester carboxylesterase
MTLTKLTANIDGTQSVELTIAYEVIGDEGGRPWIITPGGRFSKDYPWVREFARALGDLGNRVIIWDRPNTGESDVCFIGTNESALQADVLAALLTHLDVAPAVIIGGSGGARVSLLAASRHPEVASGLSVWWISGGVYGLMTLGTTYCAATINAVWNGGMEAVVALPEATLGNWQEVMQRNPSNRDRLLSQDPREFRSTMERWMFAYCPCGGATVPGLPDDDARRMQLPALVFRSGASDPNHTREQSEQVAELLPNARLVEPPWLDREWVDSQIGRRFIHWPLLAPILNDWANENLG